LKGGRFFTLYTNGFLLPATNSPFLARRNNLFRFELFCHSLSCLLSDDEVIATTCGASAPSSTHLPFVIAPSGEEFADITAVTNSGSPAQPDSLASASSTWVCIAAGKAAWATPVNTNKATKKVARSIVIGGENKELRLVILVPPGAL